MTSTTPTEPEALAAFAAIAEAILAEAPGEADSFTLFTDCAGRAHSLTIDQLRALSTPAARMLAGEGEALALELKRMHGLIYCPGVLRCAKCDFRLIKTKLTPTGAFANEEPDSCPNCNVPMWRVTWKDEAHDAYKTAESQMDRALEAERKLAHSPAAEPVGLREDSLHLALSAIKLIAVSVKTPDVPRALARIMAIARWAGVEEQYRELQKDGRIAFLASAATREEGKAMLAALATSARTDDSGVGGEHWSRQEIVKTIISAMAEAKGDVKAVPAGKAADHIIRYLASALSPAPDRGEVGQ